MLIIPKICRGLIDTPMLQKAVGARGRLIDFAHAIKRKGSPVEVAELVAWLLSDSSKFISGTVQCIDGGWAC
jgi:NAD(P)-dependent dehydrogenase (short-subunit alcohol dehydrogenase family)